MKRKNESKLTSLHTVLGAVIVMSIFVIAVAATSGVTTDKMIEKDLARVEKHQTNVAMHNEQWKESKAEGNATAVLIAKRDLCKAKADLKRSRSYLKADKKALVSAEKTAIQLEAAALKESKRELCAAKKQLKKNLRQDNISAIVDDAKLVVKKKKAVDRNETALNKRETEFYGKVRHINENQTLSEKEKNAIADGQERFAWNATTSADKRYYEIETPKTSTNVGNSSAVLEER